MTQHYLSDEQIAAERADIASLGAFFHRFDGEEHVCVPITHWRQRSAAIAAYAAQQAPIDMVLHCPKCGMQHVDMEEFTDFDRGPNTPPGNWKSWDNPPHRSHLCHACDHIWRPADVPTNGVQAVKTTGKADSPIAHPATGGAEALAEALQEASRRHYATDQATTPEFMDWLATQARREGVAANEAWNAGAAWARAALASPAVKEAPAVVPAGDVAAALSPHERSPWTEHHVKTYPRKAAQIINAALGFTPPTPAPAPAGGSEGVLWQARIALKTGVREINNLGGARQAMPLHYAIKAIDEYIAATPSMPAPATGGSAS